MKSISGLIVSLMLIVVMLSGSFSAVSALSVASPCGDESIECQVKLCHFDNELNNWPSSHGADKDCNELESQLRQQERSKSMQKKAIIGAVIGATAIAGGIVYLKTSKNKLRKK